jgi:hypothetical protein
MDEMGRFVKWQLTLSIAAGGGFYEVPPGTATWLYFKS